MAVQFPGGDTRSLQDVVHPEERRVFSCRIPLNTDLRQAPPVDFNMTNRLGPRMRDWLTRCSQDELIAFRWVWELAGQDFINYQQMLPQHARISVDTERRIVTRTLEIAVIFTIPHTRHVVHMDSSSGVRRRVQTFAHIPDSEDQADPFDSVDATSQPRPPRQPLRQCISVDVPLALWDRIRRTGLQGADFAFQQSPDRTNQNYTLFGLPLPARLAEALPAGVRRPDPVPVGYGLVHPTDAVIALYSHLGPRAGAHRLYPDGDLYTLLRNPGLAVDVARLPDSGDIRLYFHGSLELRALQGSGLSIILTPPANPRNARQAEVRNPVTVATQQAETKPHYQRRLKASRKTEEPKDVSHEQHQKHQNSIDQRLARRSRRTPRKGP